MNTQNPENILLGIKNGEFVEIPKDKLLRHVFISGSTGSGKSVLLRRIIEEAALRGVSTILFDLKGDLSKLQLPRHEFLDFEKQVFPEDKLLEKALQFQEQVYIKVSTVGGGLAPINLSPFGITLTGLERYQLKENAFWKAEELVGLLPLNERSRAALSTFLYHVFLKAGELGVELKNPQSILNALAQEKFLPDEKEAKISNAELDSLIKGIQHLSVIPNSSVFTSGEEFSLDYLLDQEKPVIHIITLVNILDFDLRTFLIGNALRRIQNWVRLHPSSDVRLLIAIDELLGLAPPVQSTTAKKPLEFLSTQARQFGVGLVLATQQPVHVDAKILSQFNTMLFGRHIGRRDHEHLRSIIRGAINDTQKISDIMNSLSRAGAGEFFLIQPDGEPKFFKALPGITQFEGPPLTFQEINALLREKLEGITQPIIEQANKEVKQQETNNIETSKKTPSEEIVKEGLEGSIQEEVKIKLSPLDFYMIAEKNRRVLQTVKSVIHPEIDIVASKPLLVLYYQQRLLIKFKEHVRVVKGEVDKNGFVPIQREWVLLPGEYPSILPVRVFEKLIKRENLKYTLGKERDLSKDDKKLINALTKQRLRELFDPKTKLNQTVRNILAPAGQGDKGNHVKAVQEINHLKQVRDALLKEIDSKMQHVKDYEEEIKRKQKAITITKKAPAKEKLLQDIQELEEKISSETRIIKGKIKETKQIKERLKELRVELETIVNELKREEKEFKHQDLKKHVETVLLRRRIVELKAYQLQVINTSIKQGHEFTVVWVPSHNMVLVPCYKCLEFSIEEAFSSKISYCDDCGRPICPNHFELKKKLLGGEVKVCKGGCS